MGTITVEIKSNPKLFALISDSKTLYYEYDSAETENMTIFVSPKKALRIIESGKSYIAKYICDTDSQGDCGKKEVKVKAPEDSRYHVCFVDGDENHIDVLVSKPVFTEHLRFMLEDERTRWEYREYCDLFNDDLFLETKIVISEHPLEETIERREKLKELEQAMKSLTSLQYKHLIKHFIQEKTVRQIGVEESTSHVNIVKSISAALKKLKDQSET